MHISAVLYLFSLTLTRTTYCMYSAILIFQTSKGNYNRLEELANLRNQKQNYSDFDPLKGGMGK